MKNSKFIQKLIIYSFLVLIAFLFYACTKDALDDTQSVFLFEMETNNITETFIYQSTNTEIELIPERKVNTVTYNFKYKILKGEGLFQNELGENLNPDEILKIKKLKTKLNYIPSLTGTHIIEITAYDSNGYERTKELSYIVDYAPFTFLLNKGAERFTINAKNPLETTLLEQTPITLDRNVIGDYKISYLIKDGSGRIERNLGEVEQNEPILLGQKSYWYVPTTLGTHTIEVTVTAPDGAAITQTLKVLVEHLNFDLIATASGNMVELATQLPVAVNLRNDNNASDVTYTITPEINGNGRLRTTSGNEMIFGETTAIGLGEFQYNFESKTLGDNTLYFEIIDSNGQQKLDSVEIEVTNIPFVFTGNSSNNTSVVNEPNALNFNLQSNANNANIDYFLTYTIIEGNGIIKNNKSKVVENNNPYQIQLGNTQLSYTPTTLGQHTIEFYVTDSYGQESATVTIDLIANHVSLVFSSSISQETMIVNSENKVTLSLQEIQNGHNSTYESSHVISGGSATLETSLGMVIAPSIFNEFSVGSTEYTFKPILPGVYTLTFRLKDSNGQVLETTENVVVQQSDFTFSGNFSNTSIAIGQSNPINILISPTVENPNIDYSMQFTSNKNGTFAYGGQTYAIGEQFFVTSGQSQAVFTPSETGSYSLNFQVIDSNGTKRTATTSMEVANSDFSLTTNANPTNIFVTETSNISIDIAQSFVNPLASYELSLITSSNVAFSYNNGSPVPIGTFIPINVGATNLIVHPQSVGVIEIEILVRDNDFNQKQRNLSISVLTPDFKLSSVPSKISEFVNVGISTNITIDELANSSNDTYEIFASANRNGFIRYEGNEYTFGQRIPIVAGTTAIEYVGSEQGTHQVTYSVTSSSGVQRSTSTNYSFIPVEFDYIPSVANVTMILGETQSISFVINETEGTSTYKQSYLITSGSGTMRDGNNVIVQQGALKDVSTTPFNWFYEPANSDTHNITFTAVNATGTVETRQLTIQVDEKDYDFTAIPSTSSSLINQSINIAALINELDAGGENYTLRYSSSSDGTISYLGTTYTPGQQFPIEVGTSTLLYQGLEEGNHAITLTATSSLGLEKSVSFTLEFEHQDYNFTANTNATPVFEGSNKDINFFINENVSGGSYLMNFVILGGNPVVTDHNGNNVLQGDIISVPATGFVWSVISNDSETVSLIFEVVNGTGLEKSQLINITFDEFEEPFVFDVTKSTGPILEGVPYSMNANIAPTGNRSPSTDYHMYFSFPEANAGTITLGGITYQTGDKIPLVVGNNNFTFTATTNGSFVLDFDANNSSGENEDDTIFLDPINAPVIRNVRTARIKYNKRSCGNGCNWNVYQAVDFDYELDPRASVSKAKFIVYNSRVSPTLGGIGNKSYNFNPENAKVIDQSNSFGDDSDKVTGEYYALSFDEFIRTGHWFDFNNNNYTLTLTDSYNQTVTVTGRFTASAIDNK